MSKIFKGFGSLTIVATSVIASIAVSQIPLQSTVALTSSKKFNRSSQLIAQNNTLYGCWKLTYSVGGVVYESLLRMNGYNGLMVTQYFNTGTRRTEFVQQSMELKDYSKGLLILGYNPVYPGTTRRHPTYSPDNFLFQITPRGGYGAATCDLAGRCSPVEVAQCPRS